MIFRRNIALVLLAAISPAIAARADDPETAEKKAREAFHNLYADELERVGATSDRADDVALAAQLLEAARKARKQPELHVLLLEKAAELGSTERHGFETAIDALQRLLDKKPENHETYRAQIFELRRRLYDETSGPERRAAGQALIDAILPLADSKTANGRFGDAEDLYKQALALAKTVRPVLARTIEARLDRMEELKATHIRLMRLETALRTNPKNTQARKELVETYLVHFDSPDRAAEFVNEDCDTELRQYVPAAARPVDEAPEVACLRLADWYRVLAQDAPPHAVESMLTRAQAYYERYLRLHKADDMERTTASLMLDKVKAALEEAASGTTTKAGGWIDMLKAAADCTRYGNWTLKDNGLFLAFDNYAYIYFPTRYTTNYELQFKLARAKGTGDIEITIPVDTSRTTIVLGPPCGRIKYVSTREIYARDLGKRFGRLPDERPLVCHIQVANRNADARILVRVDGKPYLQWQGRSADLSYYRSYSSGSPYRYTRLEVDSGSISILGADYRKLPGAE